MPTSYSKFLVSELLFWDNEIKSSIYITSVNAAVHKHCPRSGRVYNSPNQPSSSGLVAVWWLVVVSLTVGIGRAQWPTVYRFWSENSHVLFFVLFCQLSSGRPKDNFCLSAKSQKRNPLKFPFCRYTKRIGRSSFCRKSFFWEKLPLSASFKKQNLSPKYRKIADRGCFCQKRLFLHKCHIWKFNFCWNYINFCQNLTAETLPKFPLGRTLKLTLWLHCHCATLFACYSKCRPL